MSAPGQYEGLQHELLETRRRAADLDDRRQRQINNQTKSLVRLAQAAEVSNAQGAAEEIARLNEALAISQARIDATVNRINSLGLHAEARAQLLSILGRL